MFEDDLIYFFPLQKQEIQSAFKTKKEEEEKEAERKKADQYSNDSVKNVDQL